MKGIKKCHIYKIRESNLWCAKYGTYFAFGPTPFLAWFGLRDYHLY